MGRSRGSRRGVAARAAGEWLWRVRAVRLPDDRVARDPADGAVGRPDLEEALERPDDLDLVATIEPPELA